MKRIRLIAMVMLAMLALPTMAEDEELRTPAFPGAEGFGRYTTGGRGGKVYHVTTLEDGSQEGTLRWACSQAGPRTIVFDVSGTIQLNSALKLKENTTLAGQTAPGDGICIAGYQVTLVANNIVRYLRFRPGDENGGEPDGLGAMDSHDIIVDHCSVSWSVDECLSVYGSRNITVQWCIASQSLVNSTHAKKAHGYGGNWGGSGASYHHNLIAHHTARTPRLGPRPGTQTDERMDMRNNVIYNYGKNGCYGGEGMNVNIVNNYYKPGPASDTGTYGRRIAGIGIRTTSYTQHDTDKPNDWDKMWHVWGKFYVDGNVNTKFSDVTNDNWTYGIYNQIRQSDVDNTFDDAVKDSMRLSEPIVFEQVTTHSAEEAYEQVLKYAGASLHRDAYDEVIISDTRDGKATWTGSGNSKGFINHPSDVSGYGWEKWPTLEQTEPKPDTDGDGMPDEWEVAHGLDPNEAADGNEKNDEGYTWLEIYMNGLVETITSVQNEGGTALSGQQTATSLSTIPYSPSHSNSSTSPYYTLTGQQQSHPTHKGIYIINNKKILIK